MQAVRESKKDRERVLGEWEAANGRAPEFIRRSFLGYDRYAEAEKIIEFLFEELGPDFRVVDYGCGVGDYGFAFGRAGCMVTFFDFDDLIKFVNHRMTYEQKPFGSMTIGRGPHGTKGNEMDPGRAGCDLAIFGEVLEHLDDPLFVLETFRRCGTKYIFTSSYPYRSDDPNDDYWNHGGHTEKARLAQRPCRELLETKYQRVANFGGQWNLWRRR